MKFARSTQFGAFCMAMSAILVPWRQGGRWLSSCVCNKKGLSLPLAGSAKMGMPGEKIDAENAETTLMSAERLFGLLCLVSRASSAHAARQSGDARGLEIVT